MNRFFYLLVLLLLVSCDSYEIPPIDKSKLTAHYFEGIYLSDKKFFPNDTLVLKPFTIADTATKEKLMLHFKNDSVYLSNYGYDGWYGKWFCDFRSARVVFDKGNLKLHAKMNGGSKWLCDNEAEDTWRKIEYQLIDSSDQSIVYIIKTDTTNWIRESVLRFLRKQVGEEIRTDIQLR